MGEFVSQPSLGDVVNGAHGRVDAVERALRSVGSNVDSVAVYAVEHGFDPAASAATNATALQAAIGALAGQTGGTVYLGRGSFQFNASILLHHDAGAAKSGVRLVGAGKGATVLKPVLSSGWALNGLLASRLGGGHFTLDGSLASGSAGGLHLGSGTSLHDWESVEFLNFNTTGWPMQLEGSMLGRYKNFEFNGGNQRALSIINDGTNFPSNANRFPGLIIQQCPTNSATIVHIRNSEANALSDVVIQGNDGIKTVLIETTAGTSWPSRSNRIGGYFEENGNSQAGSRNISIEGANTSTKVEATDVRDCMFNASAHDNPSTDIYLTNANDTFINDNQNNLASPHKAVEKGSGVTNTHLGRNSFAGTVTDVSGTPQFRLTKTPAQTITAGNPGSWTKVTWEAESIDTNGDVDLTNDRFTPTVAGIYEVEAAIDWESVQDGIQYGVAVYKNGSSYEDWSLVGAATVTETQPIRTRVAMNGSSDYVEVFVRIAGSGSNDKNVGVRSTFSGGLVDAT